MSVSVDRDHDPYSALRSRDFRLFLVGSMASTIGNEMQAVAVMWELTKKTDSTLAVGFVGLSLALPVILLTLFVAVFTLLSIKLLFELLDAAVQFCNLATDVRMSAAALMIAVSGVSASCTRA